jgi:hypothetical protein
MVKIINSSTHRTGSQVSLKFQITQHKRDTQLMKSLVSYLGASRGRCPLVPRVAPTGCGIYISYEDSGVLEVTNIKDLAEKVIPFLKKISNYWSESFRLC